MTLIEPDGMPEAERAKLRKAADFGYGAAVVDIVAWIRKGASSPAFQNLATTIETTFACGDQHE